MSGLNDAELAELAKPAMRMAFFFRMALADGTVIRLWLGFGRFRTLTDDALDFAGETYKSAGELVDFPAFQQLSGFATQSFNFTLSGVTPEIVDIAVTSADDVVNAQINTGFAVLDDNYKPLGPLRFPTLSFAEVVTIATDSQSDPKQELKTTVVLEAADMLATRARGQNSLWSDRDQQNRHPGDTLFDFAPKYTQSYVLPFPAP